MGNYHILSAQNIGWAQQYRIAQLIGSNQSFFSGKHRFAGGSRYIAALQKLVKQFSVLCRVNAFGRGSQNIRAYILQVLGKLNGRLSAELYHHPVRLFGSNQIVHVLKCQRVKVKSITGVKVGGDGFRIVIAKYCFTAHFLKRPNAVHRTVVELYSLPYSDGAGTENKHLFLIGGVLLYELLCLVLLIVSAVKIRSIGGKFRGAGVHHFVNRVSFLYSPFGQALAGKRFDGLIKIAVFLCGVVLFLCKLAF